ncbi:hypothetical protein A2875_05120 [Candidatus Gottesmanbacteria bacterium RIFCSPHIGHO2_01_FULL_46_14]|uniref:VanZ-like domain-containing protein n=3 Tax=Candidatus Gottesmaniibacteriota TaxID=1752720 RepID=A0A1F5ZQE3_9BACT|nr:MAG: VanZ family protein [Candidatus Gottesmanbacteria bacterium GW2011_GWA1_47_8]OGG14710.1 MAG: hypothetical protein A2875_05120 [Candidatus Gottesmanbacteria bacterium RIFCSPHIGHO2_01_FULL_46_14]OGG29968.1 MAG: hypothetical protein A2971_04415 [Candidatus Gottesmanbacteria bacterium RIFCSPLOWO2_01_FULL_46_21]
MKYIRLWFPAIIWMAIIFAFSSRESVSVDERFIINFLFFKTLHVIEYGVLFILYCRAIKNKWIAFFLTIAYASTDEFHQTFVSTREGRVRDVIIDGIGATLSWIFLIKLLPKAPKKLREWGRRLEII